MNLQPTVSNKDFIQSEVWKSVHEKIENKVEGIVEDIQKDTLKDVEHTIKNNPIIPTIKSATLKSLY
jgi:hypothetical protein